MTRTEHDACFEDLLEFVHERRGFDYTPYKRPSLVRRFEKRMQAVGAATYDDYRARLEADPDEFAGLFDTILINVTQFFRDREAWEALQADVIPRIVEVRDSQPIRVWSAGCASGEEAYTAAMLLSEALGDRGFQEHVKIYATDVDEEALVDGRHATYGRKALEEVPDDLRERYFEPADSRFRIRGDLRRAVVFGRNDLLNDPPISRVDLLLCRNTLMYFARDAQMRILRNFDFALHRDGILFLGKAEALPARSDLFTAIDLRRRIFGRTGSGLSGTPLFGHVPDGDERRAAAVLDAGVVGSGFEHAPIAQLVVDGDGSLAGANEQARALFGLAARDVGRPLQDLEISYGPLDLRSAIDEAHAKRRPVVRPGIELTQGGTTRYLEAHFSPLAGSDGAPDGIAVSFTDTSRSRELEGALERARDDLATAYRELEATVEELERTNEELRSTNEELETTNEELQSTNEELETMNEELQSANEELETMNDELRDRTDDSLRATAFLTSILQSIEQSVIVLDAELKVTAWSAAAADLWGLRWDEAEGRHLANLDIGLSVAELLERIGHAAGGETGGPIELTARDRRGRLVRCIVELSQLRNAADDPQGVILVTHVERLAE